MGRDRHAQQHQERRVQHPDTERERVQLGLYEGERSGGVGTIPVPIIDANQFGPTKLTACSGESRELSSVGSTRRRRLPRSGSASLRGIRGSFV